MLYFKCLKQPYRHFLKISLLSDIFKCLKQPCRHFICGGGFVTLNKLLIASGQKIENNEN